MSGNKEEKQYFQGYGKLAEPLQDTSAEVRKFAQFYLTFGDDGKIKTFEWKKFKEAIDKLPGSDLTIDKYKETNIAQSEATVSVMVDKIVKILVDAFALALEAAFTKELRTTIETTFTGLKTAESNGWANFSKSSSGSNSSWEYRILVAMPIDNSMDHFYSLVLTIKLEADIKEESSWFGLVSSSSKNFSASITGMDLVVKKGFKHPN